MKRGGPIQRETPLRSSSPSPRDAKPKERKSTGKHVGKNKATRLAKERSGDTCEMRIDEQCLYYGSDFHHRLFQSHGGKWGIVNGLRSCRPCHGTVTNPRGRRKEFEHYGWIVPSHGNPAAVEVYMWHDERRDWFLLREDGGVDLAPFPKGDPRHPDDIEVQPAEPGMDGAA